MGVAYILDEPSIGLHQRDNDKLLNTLCHLRDLGNSVIVVEHDEDTMLAADYVVDIGPGAGEHGGQVVATGTAQELMDNLDSITGAYLSGRIRIPVPETRRTPTGWMTVKGARENNLKNIDVNIPLGKIVAVTGVSGSGKSTLVNDIIYEFALHKLRGNRPKPKGIDDIKGFENIDFVDVNDEETGYLDFLLFDKCKHRIYSNSTFSLWIRYFNPYRKGFKNNEASSIEFYPKRSDMQLESVQNTEGSGL